MGKSEAEGTFGARLIVILLAAGVVAIGLYPMRRDLRKYTQEARQYVQKNFHFLKATGISTETSDSSTSRAMMLDSAELLDEKATRKPRHIEDLSKNPPKKPVDRLTPNDRKELNDLVNSF